MRSRGGTLADQVQRRRWTARTGHQPRRPAHHLDAVVQGQIGTGNGVQCKGTDDCRQTVIHQVIDGKAAREKLLTVRAELAQRHAGCIFDDIIEVVHALIFNALAGDHAHRLRRLANRQGQPGRAAHRAGRIRATAFCSGHSSDSRLSADIHVAQRHGAIAGWLEYLHGIALHLGVKAAAQQQSAQCLSRFQAASYSRGLLACNQGVISRYLQAACLTQLCQRFGERLCGQIELDGGCHCGG